MRYEHMKLKYIVPDMAQTFGNLEFAGENDVEQQRVNGRFVPVTRSYNLYSDQLHSYGRNYLGYRTGWKGRLYRYLRSRSADKGERPDKECIRNLYGQSPCRQ